MIKLAEIDKKVIYELSKDSKQSYKQIAKKIDSKKEVIAYHIQDLIKNKIITKFIPVFSLSNLGIISHKIYIRLQGLNKEKETKLIESLIKDKEVAWIAKTIGRWDLLLGFYAKNIIEFAKVKDRILSKLSPHLEDYNLTFIEEAIILNRDYLLRDKRTNASEFLFTGKLKNEKIDNLDLSIIHELQNNSRKPILEIAHKLRLDARTIKNRIANLKHRQILQGQTIFLNLNKMNLQLHKLCITLQNYNLSNLQTMIDYCKYNPHIIHIIKSIGSWELELELEEENLEKVYHFIKLLKSEFSGIIKQVELVTIIEESKLEFFPERTKIDGAY